MLTTILIFLVILLVLVLAHELGHFVMAKWSGVSVEEFAFGFPPRLASFQKNGTRYSFNLLPLGGFVKIKGEEGERADDPRSFSAQTVSTKIIILAAGVAFNFILAYFLFSGSFIIGTPVSRSENEEDPGALVRITEVLRDSAAETAGLLPGDALVELGAGGERLLVRQISEVQNFIAAHLGEEIFLVVQRGEENLTKKAFLPREIKEGEGALGIAMLRIGFERLSPSEALRKGFSTTLELTAATASALWGFFRGLFTGAASLEEVSGPVGIVGLVGDFSRLGFVFLIQLTALLSINLALINFIPFPGLDGGRIFLLLLEQLKGSPFNWRFTRLVHAAGFVLLLLLMILVTYHDIAKFNS